MKETASAQRVWQQGKILSQERAAASLPCLAFADGFVISQDIRCFYNPATGARLIFRLSDHVERLLDACRCAQVELPFSSAELAEGVMETVRANKLKACLVRVQVRVDLGRGDEEGGDQEESVRVVMTALPNENGPGPAASVSACLSSWRLSSSDAFSLMLFGGPDPLKVHLARCEAQARGCEEVLFLNQSDQVCMAPGQNVFVLRKGMLSTPPAADGLIEGITRDTILCLADEHHIPLIEETITRSDLYTADEIFLTSTSKGVLSVHAVDGRTTQGSGQIARVLQQSYYDVACGRVPAYANWLTEVK